MRLCHCGSMVPEAHSARSAVAAREAAFRRVRRLTGAVVAGAAVLTGLFASLAAGSTPPRKAVAPAPSRSLSVRRAVTAPAPPLISSQSAAAAAATPVQAPSSAPASAAPVVVSGGS